MYISSLNWCVPLLMAVVAFWKTSWSYRCWPSQLAETNGPNKADIEYYKLFMSRTLLVDGKSTTNWSRSFGGLSKSGDLSRISQLVLALRLGAEPGAITLKPCSWQHFSTSGLLVSHAKAAAQTLSSDQPYSKGQSSPGNAAAVAELRCRGGGARNWSYS